MFPSSATSRTEYIDIQRNAIQHLFHIIQGEEFGDGFCRLVQRCRGIVMLGIR